MVDRQSCRDSHPQLRGHRPREVSSKHGAQSHFGPAKYIACSNCSPQLGRCNPRVRNRSKGPSRPPRCPCRSLRTSCHHERPSSLVSSRPFELGQGRFRGQRGLRGQPMATRASSNTIHITSVIIVHSGHILERRPPRPQKATKGPPRPPFARPRDDWVGSVSPGFGN
jgi:hypothetical protein